MSTELDIECVVCTQFQKSRIVEFRLASSSYHDPKLPRTIASVRSQELLGTLKLSPDSAQHSFDRLYKSVRKVYEESSAASTSSRPIDPKQNPEEWEAQLRRCEHALREGFRMWEAEGEESHHASDSGEFPIVEHSIVLARVARYEPGPIINSRSYRPTSW
ncbi:hypothetical protein K474DRAFT_1776569 [Panus rudis PR-1116 ss-1]|nr:hypothetical protein K474DRAFT_1776569 [Panus rudis PR-1116 ss-1]